MLCVLLFLWEQMQLNTWSVLLLLREVWRQCLMKPYVLCSAHNPRRSRRRDVFCFKSTWHICECVLFLSSSLERQTRVRQWGEVHAYNFRCPLNYRERLLFRCYFAIAATYRWVFRWKLKTVISIHVLFKNK